MARSAAISALLEGRVQHEARSAIDRKNLLLVGEVNALEVIGLLKKCVGKQYAVSPHHQVKGIDVHVFKPKGSLRAGAPSRCWYIKLYFLQPDVWVISVHES